METTKYVNARRAGLTEPGKIEIIHPTDPRHRNYPKYGANRAARRANGERGPIDLKSCKRKS